MGERSWRAFSKRRGEVISYEVAAVRFATQTRFQKIDIVETVSHGLCLFLDDKIQSADVDEFVYHEALVQPAMVAHPHPRRVFIAGGGEGATLREALRHNTVERVLMVDIDEQAVAACREHLEPVHRGAFSDPRLQLVHDDARAVLARETEDFDVMLVDVTDPLAGGPSYRLFTREFYQLARSRLSPEGVLAVQAESGDVDVLDGHLAIRQTIAEVFRHAAGYRVHVPSFGESWAFVVASDAVDVAGLAPDAIDAALQHRGCWPLRFYDGLTHRALFTPDRRYRELLRASHPIITDAQPLTIE